MKRWASWGGVFRTAVCGALLLPASCGAPTDTHADPITPLQVGLSQYFEYHYELPSEIPAGLVAIHFENTGSVPHNIVVLRATPGFFATDLNKLASVYTGERLANGAPQAVFDSAPPAGGIATIAPGTSGDFIGRLSPGEYRLICTVHSKDGFHFIARGMMAALTVRSSNLAQSDPRSDAAFKAKDGKLQGRGDLAAGQHTLLFKNAGSQPSNLRIARLKTSSPDAAVAFLKDGTREDAVENLPWEAAGGVGPIQTGEKAFATLDLTRGTYVVFSDVADRATGQSQAESGMYSFLKVK